MTDLASPRVTRIARTELVAGLPPEWPEDLLPALRFALEQAQTKVVVLDDDPTGTQTVHGVPVLTKWSLQALCGELLAAAPACYLLTNSRSLPLAEAQALNREIGRNLAAAGRQTRRACVVVSRSDSTLRGHFPGEVEALAEALGGGFDAWLLIPFFLEGGRLTVNDIHYAADGEWLVPAGESESARDPVFGYRASNLRQWVEEKTGGRIPANAVASVSIEDIRFGGPSRVEERLLELPRGCICVVNAASRKDLEAFVLGLLRAEARGRRFLYRTAASFVPVRAGITPRAQLRPADLDLPGAGAGLIIVGSHVPRTTRQVEALLAEPDVHAMEIEVQRLLADASRAAIIERAASEADRELRSGRDVAIITSRQLATGADWEHTLTIAARISEGLVGIVRAVRTRPRYLLAKGGITASDVATRGFGVERALVLGQILPGVPVWRLGRETAHPGLVYIVFPGNVGGPEAMVDIVRALRPRAVT